MLVCGDDAPTGRAPRPGPGLLILCSPFPFPAVLWAGVCPVLSALLSIAGLLLFRAKSVSAFLVSGFTLDLFLLSALFFFLPFFQSPVLPCLLLFWNSTLYVKTCDHLRLRVAAGSSGEDYRISSTSKARSLWSCRELRCCKTEHLPSRGRVCLLPLHLYVRPSDVPLRVPYQSRSLLPPLTTAWGPWLQPVSAAVTWSR